MNVLRWRKIEGKFHIANAQNLQGCISFTSENSGKFQLSTGDFETASYESHCCFQISYSIFFKTEQKLVDIKGDMC